MPTIRELSNDVSATLSASTQRQTSEAQWRPWNDFLGESVDSEADVLLGSRRKEEAMSRFLPTWRFAIISLVMASVACMCIGVVGKSLVRRLFIGPGLRPWDEACAKASEVESQLTSEERLSLLHGNGYLGVGKWVGYTPAVPRLGIPALKLQDASSGFRPTSEGHEYGTVTQWPSMLSLASTWDEALLEQVAAAIGREFRGKGANVILGPGLNVHRTPYGGRNFEYLSGESPYLGARLVRAYVKGVQGENVIAVMKHFAFNEQETSRMGGNSVVDEVTAWEHYYPPFEAAVDAGVGGVMCSYNRVNGTYACHSPKILRTDLKQKMGFKGFVVSDWGAVHASDALGAGSDMEMPDGNAFNAWSLASVSPDAIHEAARRILAAIYHLGLDTIVDCAGPCWSERGTVQRTAEHVHLAKTAAEDGVVLLKNDGLLPLRNVKKLAVIGPAANLYDTLNIWGPGSPYSGGGSGHVASTNVVTPLQGITARAQAENISILSGIDSAAVRAGDLSTLEDADVVIIVAGTSAQESQDRSTLVLDAYADSLISVVANSTPTVVLLEIPGAVLTPWRDRVGALACMFAGGEQTGAAWASVLFGDVSPSGHLPIEMPASAHGLIRPALGNVIYRYNDSADEPPAFPFGHGLSYTRFEFSELRLVCNAKACGGAACFDLVITNVGLNAGRETVQMYIQFPSRVQEPKHELRTFQKTSELKPGKSEKILFILSERDLSTYDVEAGEWRLENSFILRVGASSSDIRSNVSVSLDDLPCKSLPSPKSSSYKRSLGSLPFALTILLWLLWY